MKLHLAEAIVFLMTDAAAAELTADSAEAVSPVHGFPYVYYTPETDWAFGGTLIATFRPGGDTLLNPSSTTLDAYYTVRKQWKCSVSPEIYLSGNSLLASGSVSCGRIVDRYWGTEPLAPESDSSEYVKGMFQIQARGEALLFDKLWCGLLFEFERVWMVDKKENPLLRRVATPGASGGTSAGTGIILSWDTRDNIYYPGGGSFHQFEYTFFGHFAGSDFTYQRGVVDVRKFLSFGRHIVGIQGWGMMTTGTPPFYRLAPLGGDYVMRGYYSGRYRDVCSVAAQAEYRVMFAGPFGAAAFLGCGEVAPSPGELRVREVLPSYGAGLRFMLDQKEKLTVRLDAGFGRGTSGVYLDVREAF